MTCKAGAGDDGAGGADASSAGVVPVAFEAAVVAVPVAVA